MSSQSHPTGVVLILTTCPDDERAGALARALVEARLAACVSILPPAQAYYWWQESVESATERQLLIKTTSGHVAGVEAFFAEHHPYELPECVVVEVSGGSAAYLDWVTRETGARGATR